MHTVRYLFHSDHMTNIHQLQHTKPTKIITVSIYSTMKSFTYLHKTTRCHELDQCLTRSFVDYLATQKLLLPGITAYSYTVVPRGHGPTPIPG